MALPRWMPCFEKQRPADTLFHTAHEILDTQHRRYKMLHKNACPHLLQHHNDPRTHYLHTHKNLLSALHGKFDQEGSYGTHCWFQLLLQT